MILWYLAVMTKYYLSINEKDVFPKKKIHYYWTYFNYKGAIHTFVWWTKVEKTFNLYNLFFLSCLSKLNNTRQNYCSEYDYENSINYFLFKKIESYFNVSTLRGILS